MSKSSTYVKLCSILSRRKDGSRREPSEFGLFTPKGAKPFIVPSGNQNHARPMAVIEKDHKQYFSIMFYEDRIELCSNSSLVSIPLEDFDTFAALYSSIFNNDDENRIAFDKAFDLALDNNL